MNIMAGILPCVIATGFAALAGSPANGADDSPPGTVHVYKHSAGKPREMEIYFPPGHDPATNRGPALLLFHGGGWGGGDLSQFRRACAYFASRGLVAATANYRMLTKTEAAALPDGETRKRVCVTDAKSAIRWMKANAGKLGIDPQRILTGGGSAGGHIAVLATTNPGMNDPGDPPGIDTRVAAYLLFNPAFATSDAEDPEIDGLRHLSAGFPPAIVFFGSEDRKWLEGWTAVVQKLRATGAASVDVRMARSQGHGFFNRPPWQDVTLAAADRFLSQLGFLKGECPLPEPQTGERLDAAE